MKIILKENVENVGVVGDIITVKDGYARNFLIPKGLAMEATRSNIKRAEELKKIEERKKTAAVDKARRLAEKLKNISLTTSVTAGDDDKIFGSVTSQTVADLLAEKGYDVDKRHIILNEPIKALGVYDIPIKLHSDVTAEVKLWVVKE
ncbi:MAG: 50S ribosomal protein L9 [Marinimicrobia bacterium 46_47]|nr:MAG: 50S ribosomal protein L9 [Marinimicrobia bacterium 46_47]KUK91511.1 MAG: 50S ribosomal protein L9 [Marinimicrobia bacterium 46_43]HBY19394.1 50S ribosomal protein L9 [Candidatus Neomarinimicrobiota bacterium]